MSKMKELGLGAVGVAVLAAALPVAAQGPELAMLDRLNRGGWELRLRDDGTRHKICVRSGRELIQVRHSQPGCSRFVVKDDANEVIVQYTCRGDGYGRTTIRRESNNLAQIRSEGIKGGAPFSLRGEARHTGSC